MASRKVLVVDGEVHIVHVVATKLRNNGYEPITAGNGQEAYELACKEKPDIIISDYIMPIMSGLELLEKLRENEATRNIPFILLTARIFAIDDANLQRLNVSQCITKPFSPKELLRNIEDILSQNQSTWVFVRRCIGALFLYLIYWLTIMVALKEVVGITLSPKRASELVETGIINSIEEYGWGEHYILYLIAFCAVSYCSAILAGATAKKKGAVIAGIANLPIIVLYAFICFYLYTSQAAIEIPIAWKIVTLVSILGSIFFSAFGGLKGERWQNSTFSSKTIFGIRPLHWWWLHFPVSSVIMLLIPNIAAALRYFLGGILIKEAKYGIISFLLFVAFATFIYFVIWGWFKTFQLLSIEHKTDLSKFRIVLNVLFYLWGIPLLFYVFCTLAFYFT